ncbi:MAG: hypothetical protein CM1200mP10_20510 [Candidatus Neomarinimicrobiota bacterium]|nr:MAG: hypothetical protein CM1200mP10_20510 [Candidatus Neomarinimicrobiota bacterium]
MLQMKLLQQLPDILTAPLSAMEISIAYIIGGTVRGTVNGILVMLLGVILIDMPVHQPLATIGVYYHGIMGFRQYGVSLGTIIRFLGSIGNDAEFLFDTAKFSWWSFLFS